MTNGRRDSDAWEERMAEKHRVISPPRKCSSCDLPTEVFMWGTGAYRVCERRHVELDGITTVIFPDDAELTGVPPWDGPAWRPTS